MHKGNNSHSINCNIKGEENKINIKMNSFFIYNGDICCNGPTSISGVQHAFEAYKSPNMLT